MIASAPRTLAELFLKVVDHNQERVMLFERDGKWNSISSQDLYQRVVGVANALREIGISQGDRVAILSENRPEWTIADLAILSIGAVAVPIYATLTAEQGGFLLRHSGSRAIFVSNVEQLRKLRDMKSGCIHTVILMDDPPADADLLSMREMMDAGPRERDEEFDRAALAIEPQILATVIYTSGTTGVPKGAMLTHGNIASNIAFSLRQFDLVAARDSVISFLPLSHIFARHVDLALLLKGVVIAYCSRLDDLSRALQAIRPTVFVAVPRVYEKIYNQVQKNVATGIKKRLYGWAMKVGRKHLNEVLAGHRPTAMLWKLFDRLVYSKVRQAIGGNVRYFISGGAPLGRDLAEWYATIGLRIHEGYGLTETSPVISVNTPSAHRIGSVGRLLTNIELRVADDGELLVKGPSVFTGYWDMPEETTNAFEGEWFKTGDIGHVDADGYLYITDRKKDLIKTSGGKFIAPQPIETSLKANAMIAEAAVVGDRRNFPIVIIVPAFNLLEEWAAEHKVECTSRRSLIANAEVQALYEGIVEQVNGNLARFERVKKVLLIAEELSIANGTLTPTLKLRRRNLENLYQDQIEKLYEDESHKVESAS